MIELAEATSRDIDGIGAVVHDVWQQEILPEVCQTQIEEDTGSLWVAKEGDDVVAFISAFLTVDRAGERRWEVDLVAVRSTHQGKGLGQRLIRRLCQVGSGQDAAVVRALIRVENRPSQRAFQKAGFTTDRQVHHLLLWPPKPTDLPAPHPAEISLVPVSLLPVDTLTYRGLWIEGLAEVTAPEQRSIVGAARSIVAKEKRLKTGAVIPAEREHRLATDLRTQARMQGKYYWFVKHGSVKRKR
jgi:N-acetylglutamate synthase-like GNAT family acetyltransferase